MQLHFWAEFIVVLLVGRSARASVGLGGFSLWPDGCCSSGSGRSRLSALTLRWAEVVITRIGGSVVTARVEVTYGGTHSGSGKSGVRSTAVSLCLHDWSVTH